MNPVHIHRLARLIVCTALASSVTAWAQNVKIEEPWVRGTVAQQKATGAFMRITAEKNARLVAVSSPVAGVAEVHEMAMVDNVMKMRAIPGLALAAGKTAELKPGGYHVMLMDLKQPLKNDELVPITLVFEDDAKQRFTQEIKAPVKALGNGGVAPMQHGQHGDMKH